MTDEKEVKEEGKKARNYPRRFFVSPWPGERIRALRARFPMTQRDLAAAMGTCQQRVNEWENDHVRMKQKYSQRLSQFEMEITSLFAKRGFTRNLLKKFIKERMKQYADQTGVGEAEAPVAT